MQPSRIISSRYVYQDKWLKLRSDTVELPGGKIMDPYHAIELTDWVNVVAITEKRSILLIEQFRHVVDSVVVELPAGARDADENPEATGRRELLEETGFSGGEWHSLGTAFAAAGRLTNKVHSFLAIGVRQVAAPTPDPTENLRCRELPWASFAEELSSGRLFFRESPQMATILLLLLYAGRSANPAISDLKL